MFLRVGSGRRLGHRFRFLRGMATRIAPQVKDKIELSDAEDKLCRLLDEFTRHLASEDGIVTECRINGGWVRDKVNPWPLSNVGLSHVELLRTVARF